MSQQANPAKIGAFIVGAIFLLIAGILVFSSGFWFSDKDRYVVYFSESINGLNIGAPIKLSGVQIGQVTEIKVERDAKLNQILVPVVFEVDSHTITDYVELGEKSWGDLDMDELIDTGLRMQLQLSSLLTGLLFIEARFLPDTPAKLYHHRSDLVEIPSIPSSSTELKDAFQRALSEFRNINFQELFEEILQTVRNIEQITGSEQTQMTLTALNTSMLDLQLMMAELKQNSGQLTQDLRRTVNHADQLLITLDSNTGPLLKDTRKTVNAANATLKELQAAIANVAVLTNQDAPLSQEMETALKELSRAARSTRVMMDYLERHPEALLYGKGRE